MISVNTPFIPQESKDLVAKALSDGWVSSVGPYVEQFEQEFAHYLGVKHAVTVNTGTAALHVALLALGIGEEDEVIVPAFTMAASWMAVIYTGAKPVFADIDPRIYTIDPDLIEKVITKRTKAIMPVHIYGHPADMDPIIKIAKKYNLAIIEDAAESHGATYKGRLTGSIGDINAFSFYANKIVTTGEGGMVTTNDDSLAEKARSLKDLSHSKSKRFIHDSLGYNYRMTNMQAALGIGSLHAISESLAKKKAMAEQYNVGLSNIAGLTIPITQSWATNVYWMYSVVVDPKVLGITKDELRKRLYSKGVDTRDFFYAPIDQPLLNTNTHYKVTESIAQNGFYLPSGLALTSDEIQTVIDTLRQCIV